MTNRTQRVFAPPPMSCRRNRSEKTVISSQKKKTQAKKMQIAQKTSRNDQSMLFTPLEDFVRVHEVLPSLARVRSIAASRGRRIIPKGRIALWPPRPV